MLLHVVSVGFVDGANSNVEQGFRTEVAHARK